MLIVILIFVGLSHGKSFSSVDNIKTLDPIELIDFVNSLNTTWKAGVNFGGSWSLNYMKKLVGSLEEPNSLIKSKSNQINDDDDDDYEDEIDLPNYYDAREAWPGCDSISTIRDQGACGSCWAVGSVSSMSDRLCIKSNGKINVQLSAEDVLSCCGSVCGFGCKGGYAVKAFNYWVENGIVTGGSYQGDGCQPYSIQPCEHHVDGSRPSCEQLTDSVKTPFCMEKCVLGYEKNFTSDKFYGSKAYALDEPFDIKKDILTNGPVAARMNVYDDFYHYKSGVYQHVTGKDHGAHTVKLIGWGSDQGVDYWLVANSWNTDWGDKGTFKIVRDVDECGIESHVIAALPKI